MVGRKNSFSFADKFRFSSSKNLKGSSTACPIISSFRFS